MIPNPRNQIFLSRRSRKALNAMLPKNSYSQTFPLVGFSFQPFKKYFCDNTFGFACDWKGYGYELHHYEQSDTYACPICFEELCMPDVIFVDMVSGYIEDGEEE